MQLIMCAIYDRKLNGYMTPFFVQTEAMAVRGFINACENEESTYAKNSEDFSLHSLAKFDCENGQFVEYEGRSLLAAGSIVMRNESDE